MSAARGLSNALRPSVARQLTKSAASRRTFVSAMGAATRQTVARPVALAPRVQSRGLKTVDFAGHKEDVFGESLPFPTCAELDRLAEAVSDLHFPLQSVRTGPRRSSW